MAGKAKSTPKKTGTKKKSSRFRWIRFFLKLAVLGIVLFGLLFASVWIGLFGHIPSKTELNLVKTPLASEVISADGKLLGRYYVENRSYVYYKEISTNIINALIATEDARFFKHRGIDEVALLRVFVKTLLLQDRSAGGGSTLSQQIAKNLFPRKKIGLLTLPVSKIREAIIAYRLENIYTKEEILTLYLNTVPFGENIFGIALASERFFSKRPSEISVPEAAVLVGILKANQSFNPRLHPDRSLERRNLVLDLMVKNDLLPADKGKQYKAMPLGLSYSLITFNQGPAPYLLEHLRPELTKWCESNTKENGDPWNLYTDGLKIHTTVDSRMQRYAVSAVNEQMKVLQKIFDEHWKGRAPWGDNQSVVTRAMQRTDRYRIGKSGGKSIKQLTKEFSEPTEMTLFTWNGMKSSEATPLDSVKHYLKMLNAGMLVLENRTGAVKAWIGGIDYRFFKFDYIHAARQTGSTFKPFVFLSALENGLSPLDYYSCEEQTYEEYDNWTPGNASSSYSGYYTMRAALAKSINTVTVDISMQTGISNMIETARDLGIKADLPDVPSLALGVASVPLGEMVPAYAAIANGGKVVKPYTLVRIEDKSGKILAEFEAPEPEESGIDPENCRLVTDMLQYAVQSGTGAAIRSKFGVPGDFAGKTGTTQDYADGWFIGYTPDYTAGCWVGADDPAIHFRTLALGGGSHTALPVVGRFFAQVLRDPGFSRLASHRFERPDSLLMGELLAMADHVESIERDFNFFGIFGKKKTRAAKAEPDESATAKPEATPQRKDQEPVWEKIKRIFKKK